MSIDEILVNFEFLDDWEDRYRYVIELGRELEPLPDAERTDATKVQGCVSQVWLSTHIDSSANAADPVLRFVGDSDAHIVRGLVAILITMLSGKTASEILGTDVAAVFDTLGFREHLTPQRSNGLTSIIARIRRDAEAARA